MILRKWCMKCLNTNLSVFPIRIKPGINSQIIDGMRLIMQVELKKKISEDVVNEYCNYALWT